MPRFTFEIHNSFTTRDAVTLPSAEEARREAIRAFGEILTSEADELAPEASLQVMDDNGKPIVHLVLTVQGFDGGAQA